MPRARLADCSEQFDTLRSIFASHPKWRRLRERQDFISLSHIVDSERLHQGGRCAVPYFAAVYAHGMYNPEAASAVHEAMDSPLAPEALHGCWCVQVHVRVRVRTYVRARVCVRVCVCACARAHAFALTGPDLI